MARAKKATKAGQKKRATQKEDASAPVSAPYHLPTIQNLRDEIDRVFESADWRFLSSPARRASTSIATLFPHDAGWSRVPAIDFDETDKSYKITAELPGMEEKDIKVGLSNSILTISGEKKEEKEEKQEGYHLSERRYGSFERRLHVPHGVDTSKISAKFKNGVLTVGLPKLPKARQDEKKISVEKG